MVPLFLMKVCEERRDRSPRCVVLADRWRSCVQCFCTGLCRGSLSGRGSNAFRAFPARSNGQHRGLYAASM